MPLVYLQLECCCSIHCNGPIQLPRHRIAFCLPREGKQRLLHKHTLCPSDLWKFCRRIFGRKRDGTLAGYPIRSAPSRQPAFQSTGSYHSTLPDITQCNAVRKCLSPSSQCWIRCFDKRRLSVLERMETIWDNHQGQIASAGVVLCT